MFLPIRKYFRKTEPPLQMQGELDFLDQRFDAFSIAGAAQYTLKIEPEEGTARVYLNVNVPVQAECARCLGPADRRLLIEQEFQVREEDLTDEMAELPFTEDGSLDTEELVYQEVLLEAPTIFLCSDDCEGLCQRCGRPKSECKCAPEQEGDPRLQVLRSLLQEQDD